MRYGAITDNPVYQGCRRLTLWQEADNPLRESIAFGGLPARAATDTQDFHHLPTWRFFPGFVAHAQNAGIAGPVVPHVRIRQCCPGHRIPIRENSIGGPHVVQIEARERPVYKYRDLHPRSMNEHCNWTMIVIGGLARYTAYADRFASRRHRESPWRDCLNVLARLIRP